MKTASSCSAPIWVLAVALQVSPVHGAEASPGRIPAIIPRPKSVRMAEGELTIQAGSRVLYVQHELAPLAQVVASDIERIHGVALHTMQANSPENGDILLRLTAGGPKTQVPDAYELRVDSSVVVDGDNYGAVACGTMTAIQALRSAAGGLSIPKMTVVDFADREFRAVQVCIKGSYHAPQWVKRVVDLLRFYKIRLLELHTAESMWMGCVMASVDDVSLDARKKHLLWTRQEMDDVIAYGKTRGVLLFPHNESVPHYAGMKNALTGDFNTDDAFVGLMDEFDGRGPYSVESSIPKEGDARYWAFMREVTQRSYDQFAAGWPGGRLPYYHMGPVYGEGGTTPANAVKLLTFLRERNPDINLMYWNGPSAQDPVLRPYSRNIVGAYYSKGYGAAPQQLFKDGGRIINVSADPLYFAVGLTSPRSARQGAGLVCEQFHIARLNDIDCTPWVDQVLGAMLPTWEMREDGHIEALLECVPFFAEHVWNVKPLPHPPDIFEQMSNLYYGKVERLAKRQICLPRPPGPPRFVTATQGLHADRVTVLWAAGDNFPEYFEVHRAEENDSATASVVSGRIMAAGIDQLNIFEDRTARPDGHGFYWVRSVNHYGASAFSEPAEGFRGQVEVARVEVAPVYEPFDYEAGSGLAGLNGGEGWGGGWTQTNIVAIVEIAGESLAYPGLETRGGRFRMSPDPAYTPAGRDFQLHMTRPLRGTYGTDGTEVWMSLLLRGKASGNSTFGVSFGKSRVGRTQFSGQFWANGVRHPAKLETGRTYLLVTRQVFHKGNDLLHLWVDPAVGTQPGDEDALIVSRKVDNNAPRDVDISLYRNGITDYEIDEIRIGKSYADVTPGL